MIHCGFHQADDGHVHLHVVLCCDLQALVHELRITNQVMYVNPAVEDAQYQLLQELFAWEAIVTMLPRIQHSRYQVRIRAVDRFVPYGNLSHGASVERLEFCSLLYYLILFVCVYLYIYLFFTYLICWFLHCLFLFLSVYA